METPRTTVWLIEDDPSFRQSVLSVLETEPALHCPVSFSSVEDALILFDSEQYLEPDMPRPDVILLDINLPGASGLESIRTLKERSPQTRVVMLTIHDDAGTIFEAFRQGASGYLPKNAGVDAILLGVEEAARGGTLMPAPVARKVLAQLQAATPATDYNLSDREMDVLREMTLGKSQQRIADSLYLSRHTVNTHIQHIYEKLHVNSGLEAVAKALRERIV